MLSPNDGHTEVTDIKGATTWSPVIRKEHPHLKSTESEPIMHDSEKGTLCAIKLKTEIARRLIDSDDETASEELLQVECLIDSIIRQSHHKKHRNDQPFAIEVENAKQLLETASITVRVAYEESPDPQITDLLRLVLRKATAKVLNHPTASTASIIVTKTGISILNNGLDPRPTPPLHGLDTLKDTIEASGGELITVEKENNFLTACSFINT